MNYREFLNNPRRVGVELNDHLTEQHDLVLLDSELDEIILVVAKQILDP